MALGVVSTNKLDYHEGKKVSQVAVWWAFTA